MQTIPPKGILLDMDDTIIAYECGVDTDACWRIPIRRYLPEMETANAEYLLRCIKEHASWYWSDPDRHRTGRLDLFQARRQIISAALEKLEIQYDVDLEANIAEAYGELRDQAVTLFPNAIETIKHLRAKGIKLALLTNGGAEKQWNKIRRFELETLFDCILVEGEFGIGKPEERIYRHALEQLGVTADEAWMVGDNFEWEIVAPQRMGIKGIWLDHKKKGVPVGSAVQPYKIIESISDLLDYV